MACKYTYGNQVYDSLDDLKAAVKNDLQRSADKEDVGLSAHPVTKIISGAQTGVDMAGLDAGKEIGIPTGGTAAAKFQQSVGEKQKEFKPELANIYGLKEGKVTKRFTQDGRQYDDVYYQRTLDNAQEADGTIWFGNAGSPGGKLTLGKDAQKGKPAPLVNPTSAQEIRNWLNKHNIKTLNVAGNREYTNPGIYDKAKTLLVEALKSNIVDNNNQSNTAEQSTNVKGENISSAGSAFAKELTNPGNSLTVEYNNNIFRNAEHAYQTWKSGTFDEAAFNSTAFIPRGNKPAYKNTNYTTMVEILTAKLVQHPKLVKGIDERGGLAYIQNSTHIVKGDAYWESTGQNKFIQALADAYRAVKNTNDLPIQYRYNIPNANAVQKELKLPSTSEVLAVARNFKMIIGDVQMEDAYGGIVKPYLSKKTADLVNTYFKGGFQHWAGKSPEHIAQHVKLSKELNESMLNDYIKYLQDNGWKKGLEPYTGEIPSDAYSVPTNQNTSSQQSNTTQQSNIRLKDYSNARLPNNKDLPLGIKLSVLTPNGNIKNQSKIWSILKNNFSSDVLDKLNDMLYFNIEGDWLFNHFNRNVIFLKVGEGIIPFYFSSKGTSNKSLTWHPFFGIDKDENWIFKQVYNPQTKTTQIEGWNTVYPKEIKMLNETLDWLSNNFNINNIKMDLITSGSMFNLKRNIFVNQTIVDSENPTTTAAGQITGQSTLPHASDFVAFFLNTVSGKFKIINTIQQIDTKQQPKTEAKITDAEVEAMTGALVEMYPEIEFGVENNPNFVNKEGVFNQIEDNDFINLVTHDNLLTGNIVIGDSFATFTLDLKAGELKDISLAKELQGKGIGSDIYLKLNALLNRKGMVLKSSDNLSKASEALWESLYKKGYVEKTPAKIKRNYEDIIQEGVTDLSGKTDIVDGFTYKFKNNQQTNIKEGVPELFDSNPELANAVYEALGLKSKLSDIKPKVSITNYRNVTKQDKQNAVNGDIEAQKKWMIEEISEFYEAVDGFNNNTMSIDDVGEEVLGLFRTAQQFPEVKDFINPYIEDVQIALDNINKKEQYDKFKSKKTAKGQAEDMTFDNLFDFVNSFPNSKKQQALQLYSQYLDTIFPDSKVKDIVYHHSDSKITEFKREFPEGYAAQKGVSPKAKFFLRKALKEEFLSKRPYVGQYLINTVNPNIMPVNADRSAKRDSGIKEGIQEALENGQDGAIFDNIWDNRTWSDVLVVFEPEQIHILGSKQDVQGFKEFQNQQDTLLLNQKTGKDKIIGQADIQARKILIDAAFKNKPDLASHEFAHFYIAWFRNTPLVQQGIKMYGSEEALVQAIGEQAVVQRGKAWSWWKKFVAWLLNSANDVSDLTKENLRDILTDAFLSRQDLNKQAGTEAGVKLEKNVAVLGGETYLWNNNTGFWQPFTKSEADIEYSNDEMQRRMQEERDEKAQVKNDVVTKPAWKNNKRAALENRLLNIHKAIALHPVNAQNLLAPVSTVITKGIVKKLGIRAKHETRGAVIDPLSNINASIAMVQGKQGVGIVANAINTKAALTGVDAKLTSMYPVQSPLSTDEKHTQLPINLRMLGIEKVRYADGTLAYSLGKLVDTFGNSIISNLSESLTQQVDNVKDPVAVELGYTLKTLGLTSYILTLGVPQEILAGLTAKGGIVTAWNDRVEENENLFHKGVTETNVYQNEFGQKETNTTKFEESNSTLKVEFIAALLRKEGVPSKYIETVVDENRKVKGYLLKHEALDADNVSLDKYDAVKLLFYWELIDQARAYGNTIKALTADTKTHKSIDAAAQQQLLIDQQLAGIDSIIDKDDISKVISSRTALKSNTKSVISPFFNMQRKYIEYFSKYFYTHDNGISSYLAANLKARYKLYNGDKLNRLISTAHNDFMIYLMTRMTAVNSNATSSLAKYNIDTAPLVEANALLKHGEGLKMSAVNSIYNNLVLISKQPNLTTSQNYYYAQPASARKNSTIELYQNITPEMARSLLDIFRFELGRVIKADVNVDNNTSIYLQNIPSVDLIMFKDSAITTSAANNYIEIFEELRTKSPKLIQLFNSISLFQAGLNNSPYNLFKTLPITDLLSEDKSKSLVSNLATTIRTFDKLLPKKGVAYSAEADKRSDAIYNMVDDFLRWFDLQYGKIYVQPEAASKYNKASRLYKAFSSKDQKFIIYVKNDEGGGTPLESVSSLTKNYLSTVPYTYAPTTTAVTNSNVITNDTINEDATIKQLESLGAFGDIIKAYVAAGGEIETLCS